MNSQSDSVTGSSQQAQLLVLGGILVALMAGIWFAWSTFAGDSVPVGKEIEVGAMWGGNRGAMANRMRARAQQSDITQQPDGIRALGAGQVSVKSGDYFTQLPEAADAPDNVRLYTAQNLISPELDTLLRARVDLATNTKLAEQLKITKEQIEKLTKIPLNRGAGLRLDKNDREEIKTLWKAVYSTPAGAQKDAATQTFLAKIREIGDRNIEPTRQLMNKRGDDIKAILTGEQLQKYLAGR